MRVRVQQTVDVDCDVRVDVQDIIAEFSSRRSEATPEHWRMWLESVAVMTRIMESVPDDVIASIPEDACEKICERLMNQAQRYDRSV